MMDKCVPSERGILRRIHGSVSFAVTILIYTFIVLFYHALLSNSTQSVFVKNDVLKMEERTMF